MARQLSGSKVIHQLRRSIYLFPLIIVIGLLFLTALKINGSSVGYYHSVLYGKSKDPDLIYGNPQPIRSDEYLTATPLIALQAQTGFPKFNKDLGSGRDVAILPDAPTKDWVTFFRPQNWSFFVLPFEYAFAFKWWFGIALLIITAYFFTLRILDGNKKFAVILSLAFSLSPFFLWWYQSTLFIPAVYSFLMLVLGIRIIRQEKIPRINSVWLTNLVYLLGLAYLGASFVLFLYAPYLIAMFLVMAAFIIGYLLNERYTERGITTKQAWARLGLMLTPLLIIAPLIALFSIENKDMIHAIANSVYPGHRVVHSGGLHYSPTLPIFGSFLLPLIQSASRAVHYYSNQSETSNFILLLPFLIIPGIFLQISEFKKSKKINFVFLAIQLISLLFLLRISVHFGDKFYNLLLLDKVPHDRLLAGLGLVGFLQLVYMFKLLPELKIRSHLQTVLGFSYGVVCFVAMLVLTFYVKSRYPQFVRELYYPLIFAAIFTMIIVLLLVRRLVLAALLLLVFTLLSSFRILPLYHGLDFLHSSDIVKEIQADSKPTDHWAVVDNFSFENLPLAAGRGLVNGAQIYTDLNFWRQLDKDRKFEYVYNRQAHALFVSNTAIPDKYFRQGFATINGDLQLFKGNVFKVKFSCSEFIYKNVDYALATHTLDMPCLSLKDKVVYPATTFYIYKVHPVN